MTTRARRSAAARTSAAPRPQALPVTSTTLPLRPSSAAAVMRAASSLARDPDHLGAGGDAAEDLLDRGLAQRAQALLARALEQLRRRRARGDERADLVAHREDLVDARAPAVARLPAVQAAAAALEAVLLQLVQRHAQHRGLLGRRHVLLQA